MPKVMRYSTATANEQTALIATLLNAGRLRIYTAPMPASVDQSPTGADLLLEVNFDSPAFDNPTNGAANAHPMAGSYALTGGRAAWYRTLRQDGTPVFDGTVGRTGDDANLLLDQVDLEQGALVTIQGFAYQSPTE